VTELRDRPVALVTGASRGIGRAIATELGRSGFDLVGNATRYDPNDRGSGLGSLAVELEGMGAAFAAAPGDVSNLDVHPQIVAAALDRFGRIDLLVNNAGVAPTRRRDILEATAESYDRVLAVNARGPFFLTQRVAQHMIEQPKKAPSARAGIIFVTSVSAVASSPSRAEYCVSKAALSQTARVFADRLAEHDIRVYEVRPGLIRTDMTASVEAKYDALIAGGSVPQGRWGLPRDVARAVAALARGDFDYSTGLVVEVSGGMDTRRL
jgi:3-oxoacyl-[acyl-carrier protein] reductase